MLNYSDIFSGINRILFVAAHPDDVDVLYGGLLALLSQDKKEIFVLLTTNGGRGSKGNTISEQDLGTIRLSEEHQALNILGVKNENFSTLNYLDGEVENNLETIGQISYYIRKFQPNIVCTQQPHNNYILNPNSSFGYINHRDHRNTGQITLDAVYPFSRDKSFFANQFSDPLIKEHHVKHVLLANTNKPNCAFDITNVVNKKRQALLSHQSQFNSDIVNRILENQAKDHKYYEEALYLQLPW